MQNILNDFDDDKNAIIEPWFIAKPISVFPEIAVLSFNDGNINTLASFEGVKQISEMSGGTPIYSIKHDDTNLAFYKSRVGASACVIDLEKIISYGVRTVVAFGSCGVLDKEIADGNIIIPVSAIRDEGTSYHYAPASQEIDMEIKSVDVLIATMDKMGCSWLKGKTWTTDAPFRETIKKTALRKSQGCISVEMECSAMLAVAKFRGIKFAQFLYAADNLDAPIWDPRNLFSKQLSQREKYILIALEAAINLHTA
jgi:uridine phosphorylase